MTDFSLFDDCTVRYILLSSLPSDLLIEMSLTSHTLRTICKSVNILRVVSTAYLPRRCDTLFSLILCYNMHYIGKQWQLFYGCKDVELREYILADNYRHAYTLVQISIQGDVCRNTLSCLPPVIV